MKSLLIVDHFLRPDAIAGIIESVQDIHWTTVHKTTPAIEGTDTPQVERFYDVIDGQKLTHKAPHLWEIYENIGAVVRECFNAEALTRLHNRADFVLKRYYPPAGRQSLHRDVNPIGAALYLTNEIQGGETVFETGLSVKPRGGRLAIFDGHIPHESAPVRRGEKWAFICNFYLPGQSDRPAGADHVMLEAR